MRDIVIIKIMFVCFPVPVYRGVYERGSVVIMFVCSLLLV